MDGNGDPHFGKSLVAQTQSIDQTEDRLWTLNIKEVLGEEWFESVNSFNLFQMVTNHLRFSAVQCLFKVLSMVRTIEEHKEALLKKAQALFQIRRRRRKETSTHQPIRTSVW